jgi:hypothetical protein
MKHPILIASLVLAGCAQPVKQIYQWDGYQPALYQHLKSDGAEPGAQISALEAQLQKNEAAGVATPPGMRAHLAMLYSKAGDDVSARRLLEAERAKFPEAAAYVDFLLKAKSSQGVMPSAAASSPSKI